MAPEARRVCIDARLLDGVPGGVQQIVLGIADGLGKLGDGEEEYLFLTFRGEGAWLRPFLKGPCRELEGPPPPPEAQAWKAALRARVPRRLWDWAKARVKEVELPASGGEAEAAGCGVVHFPFQAAFRTRLPSLYMPQDFQHRHLPENFTAWERRWRDESYAAFSRAAHTVVVMTRWGRADLLRWLPDLGGRVAVVPGASVLAAYRSVDLAQAAARRAALGLTDGYFVYSAQTFPHKNHAGLLRAVARLRDREGLVLRLACPGRKNAHWPVLESLLRKLKLERQVLFTGNLGPNDLQSVYAGALAMIIPSRFEGWGMPLTEAFDAGLPVAVAGNTCLPEVAGDAALVFDAFDPGALAGALRSLASDPGLRATLVERGRARRERMSWTASARAFRALYRHAAGWDLSDADQELIRAAFEGTLLP